MNTIRSWSRNPERERPLAFFIDLALYLPAMFLVREISFSAIGFIGNGLLWSLATLAVASWRLKARGVSWRDLGLRRPESYKVALIATVSILGLAIASIILFQVLNDHIAFGLAPDTSDENAVSNFGDLRGNWILFLTIMPFVWLESLLEEVLDRGFLMNWLERLFPSGLFTMIFALVAQAAIFGYRHSHDLSERAVTVGLIGLAMGIGYVAFGRNLWPLIAAHGVLNTISMLDRVN